MAGSKKSCRPGGGKFNAYTMDQEVHPINTFSRHYRQKYGGPVGKIAFDTGSVCPNRRKGGCIYCAAESFTPFYLNKGDAIAAQLAKGKAYLNTKKFSRFFAYFQQETTTALPFARLEPMLQAATADQSCVGLIISTRPDYIEETFLDYLAAYGSNGSTDRMEEMSRAPGMAQERPTREALLELGLQSAHDRTLALLNRNHSYQDFVTAANRVKKRTAITMGVHLILGLPGETEDDMIATIRRVIDAGVDYIKLHHLQIIRGTPLAAMHQSSPIKVYDAGEYLDLLATILAHIPQSVVLHRLWSMADTKLLVAPRWNQLSYELNDRLQKILSRRELYQGKYASVVPPFPDGVNG